LAADEYHAAHRHAIHGHCRGPLDASGTEPQAWRADQIGNPNFGVCGGPTPLFQHGAFAAPPTGQYGDARRDTIEGPCSFTWNLSMNKAFRLGTVDRQRRGEIAWQIQNLTNTVNYTGVGTTFGSSTFGRVTSAGNMRTMSLTPRFNF
jgi:hypothetical protein